MRIELLYAIAFLRLVVPGASAVSFIIGDFEFVSTRPPDVFLRENPSGSVIVADHPIRAGEREYYYGSTRQRLCRA